MITDTSLSTFGGQLKYFRKRRGFTQQQLATAIGVHRNAIGRWEQGDFLPESKVMVLAITRELHLDNQEGRQLLEASFTALAPPWNVPYQRNPFFMGHQEILDTLHQYLNINQVVACTQSCAVQGLGGIGKTQLAVEYAYRYALEYSAVLWISAESVENIIASFFAIAELLQLPERQGTDQQQIVRTVQNWLATHSKWLLIWDALEDTELLWRSLPTAHQGALLITTRRQALGTLARGLNLPTLRQAEGVLFLLRRAKILSSEATNEQMYAFAQRMPIEYTTAEKLVTMMGGLPLALDQIGSYIEETGCSLSDYLRLYEQQCKQLLDRRGLPARDHSESVFTTLSIAYEYIERADPIAVALLYLYAFLHPDAIPEELIEIGASYLKSMLQPVIVDTYQLDQAIATLRSFSLINRCTETHTFSIHRLVQTTLKENMDQNTCQQWIRLAVRVVNAAFSSGDEAKNGPRCQRYLVHVEMCADYIDRWKLVFPEAGQLLHQAGVYLQKQGQYAQAERLLSQAQAICLQIAGEEARRGKR
jgi:transcriptional regulator with XRE-family HTH domain